MLSDMTDIIQEARGLLHDFETESGSIAQEAEGMFFLVDRTAWTKLVHSHCLNQETPVGHAGRAELFGIEVELADLTEGEPEIRLLRKPDCTNSTRPETITPAALKGASHEQG